MGERLGRYELLRKLASGGMGEVYVARYDAAKGVERRVVIKVLLPHLVERPGFLEMFFDEARLVARLDHPNVAHVYEMGEADGLHYLAMELVRGLDVMSLMQKALAAGTPIPVPLAVRIVAEAAAGLDYAHQAKGDDGRPLGLVHRDVSPQNILVSSDGAVKVIDFGVAKAASRVSQTEAGMVKGKLAYMPPEQLRGMVVDARADEFALGIVLHELLTGRPLFARDTDVATMQAVGACEVPPPQSLNPSVDERLAGIVMRMLAPTPEQRFADLGEVRLALEDWLVQSRARASAAHLAAFVGPFASDARYAPDPDVKLTGVRRSVAARSPEGLGPGGFAFTMDENADWAPPGATLDASGVVERARAQPGAAAVAPVARRLEVEAKLELDTEKLAAAQAAEHRKGQAEAPKFLEDAPSSRIPFSKVPLFILVMGLVVGAGYVAMQHFDVKVPALPSPLEESGDEKKAPEYREVSATTQKGQPLLTVVSEPDGAQVYVGQELLGTTPYAGDNDLPDGTYRLRVVKAGYKDYSAMIEGGKSASISATLKR